MEIIKKPQYKYDPFNLPKAIDFHLAMKKIDLPQGAKSKMQIALSKMGRKQLKETIEYLNDMRYTAMNHFDYKMASYCESVKNLVEEYFKSIKAQNRV
jgi:iron-sulfur cluster repair protein YtfE (RIC family)